MLSKCVRLFVYTVTLADKQTFIVVTLAVLHSLSVKSFFCVEVSIKFSLLILIRSLLRFYLVFYSHFLLLIEENNVE